MDPYEGVDFEHLAACVDPHCGYCNDVPSPEDRVKAFLEAMVDAPEQFAA